MHKSHYAKFGGTRSDGHYNIPEAKERSVCAAFNARVGTLAEMIFFQKHDGAQWCACSNVADRTTSHYPMQNGSPGTGCGGSTGGVRNCGTRLFDDVFCVRGPLLITPTVKGRPPCSATGT